MALEYKCLAQSRRNSVITKQDILDRAAEWHLRPEVVEKDYVLGWLLVGLGASGTARNAWILKGGTCIKKCYFETYRFSEDLDFSLGVNADYSNGAIREVLVTIARIAAEFSGISFREELFEVRDRHDKLGRLTFQGRIAYQGPLAIPSVPRVLLDITRHEPIIETPHERVPLHPYPDQLPTGVTILTYSLDELLAEKTRALYERALPRDLYDVVYLLQNHPDIMNLPRTGEIFQQKCASKRISCTSSAEILRVIREAYELRSEWENMLSHQLPILPKLDDVLARLPALLAWVDRPEVMLPDLTLPAPAISPLEQIVAPPGIIYWGMPLETVRSAAANRLLVEFDYHGRRRVVEPYSLRRSTTGKLLLYAWDLADQQIKAFNVPEIQNAGATTTSFQPRFRVELTSGGTISAPPARIPQARSYSFRPVRSSRTGAPKSALRYVFECPYCNKRFRHIKNDPSLRKHKMKDGYTDCPGRRGHFVTTEYA